jgi:adenylate cyclase
MLFFLIANEQQRQQIQHARGPIEFGRRPVEGPSRVVIKDPFTSRDQLRVEELPGGVVRLENLGSTPVMLADGTRLASGQQHQATPPLRIVFGRTTLDVSLIPNDEAASSPLQTIAAPVAGSHRTTPPPKLAGDVPSAETLHRWFETLLAVQRSAAGSTAFYAETAQAVVQLVGLDRGVVVLRRGTQWEVVASYPAGDPAAQRYSQRIVRQVEAERRTLFERFDDADLRQSLVGVEAVVASPIFDEAGAVVGVVYGSRDRSSAQGLLGITPLEAQFVQVLAGAVSAGLARLASEAEAARARVQLEQFFSPELARALERDEGILAARQRTLTLLFADLRGFSRIAERIGATQTFALLSDILDRLTNRIMDRHGVVIDYYGDGVAAMWNAPTDVPDHADQAVAAALDMLGDLPAINHEWAEKLGGLIRLGIGLHTGQAQVGNSGSRRRLKYGPRGHAVNLTSRIEAATKVLGVSCLISEATTALLSQSWPLRRIGRVRLTGMTEPVTLFELNLCPDESLGWHARKTAYEQAVALFEAGQTAAALEAALQLQETYPQDGPTQWLSAQLSRPQVAEGLPPGTLPLETK